VRVKAIELVNGIIEQFAARKILLNGQLRIKFFEKQECCGKMMKLQEFT